MVTTTDLTEFSDEQIRMTAEILSEWSNYRRPDDFYTGGLQVMMNKNSGNVFLTNTEYQVAMMNGDKLASFYSCAECGHEGFAEEGFTNEDTSRCNECHAKSVD